MIIPSLTTGTDSTVLSTAKYSFTEYSIVSRGKMKWHRKQHITDVPAITFST